MDILKNATQNRGLSKDVIERIIQFYDRDDITWQAPGRKDVVLIRRVENGVKNKYVLQSRYVLMSLAEAYKQYCQDHPNEVGLSKFCDLRPKYIKVFDKLS